MTTPKPPDSTRIDILAADVAQLDAKMHTRERRENRTKLKAHITCIVLGALVSLLLAYLNANVYVLTGFPWAPNVLIELIDWAKKIT